MVATIAHRTFKSPTSYYETLRVRIGELGSQFTSNDVHRLLAFVKEISAPKEMLHLLNEVISNNELLQTIAQCSYRHVNHFDKIVLVEAVVPNGFRLTAHLWNPPYTEADLSDELIHDHRFSFWSAILVGTLHSKSFFLDDYGPEYHKYSYKPENKSRENFYAFEGIQRLRPGMTAARSAGNAYFLDYPTIHKVLLPCRQMVCTLVLRGPRARLSSNVYNTTYPQIDTSVSNTMFTESELLDRLTLLYSALTTTNVSADLGA